MNIALKYEHSCNKEMGVSQGQFWSKLKVVNTTL